MKPLQDRRYLRLDPIYGLKVIHEFLDGLRARSLFWSALAHAYALPSTMATSSSVRP